MPTSTAATSRSCTVLSGKNNFRAVLLRGCLHKCVLSLALALCCWGTPPALKRHKVLQKINRQAHLQRTSVGQAHDKRNVRHLSMTGVRDLANVHKRCIWVQLLQLWRLRHLGLQRLKHADARATAWRIHDDSCVGTSSRPALQVLYSVWRHARLFINAYRAAGFRPGSRPICRMISGRFLSMTPMSHARSR